MGLVDASTQLDPTTLVLGLSEGDGAGVPVGLPVAGQVLIEPGPGIPGILIGNNPTNNSITVSVSPSIKCSIWDTDFDTYVSVCSANTIFAKAGGSEALRISATRTIIYAGNVIVLDSTASWTQLRANNQIVLNALDTITGLYRPDSATTRSVVYAEPTKTTISAEDAAGTGEVVVYGSNPYHGIVDMELQSGISVWQSFNRPCNINTYTNVAFNQAGAGGVGFSGYDIKTEWVGSAFTAKKGGRYLVTATVEFVAGIVINNNYGIYLFKNNANPNAGVNGLSHYNTKFYDGGSCKVTLTAVVLLNPSAVLRLFAYQAAANCQIRGDAVGHYNTWMQIQKLA